MYIFIWMWIVKHKQIHSSPIIQIFLCWYIHFTIMLSKMFFFSFYWRYCIEFNLIFSYTTAHFTVILLLHWCIVRKVTMTRRKSHDHHGCNFWFFLHKMSGHSWTHKVSDWIFGKGKVDKKNQTFLRLICYSILYHQHVFP